MINSLLVADNVVQIRHFAVAIQKLPHNTHAGVIYVSPTEGGLHLLHLRGPGQLARESWNQEWGWAGVGSLKREELYQLSVLCQYVFEAREDIPYGFKYNAATHFLRDGRLQTADGCRGLTCSTFVLALLASFEIMLLDFGNWPVRPEDEQAVRWIATAQGNPEVAAEFPCTRYKPEEVIAACTCNALNVRFDVAEPLGRQVVEKMTGYLDRKRSGI
jgi:hypothetical protein